MDKNKRMVCPMKVAGLLDSKFRKLFHNPNKILKPFIKRNISALDIGCGPGVFSIEIAKLMEGTGKVISVDMQEGMLEIIKKKIDGKIYKKNRLFRHYGGRIVELEKSKISNMWLLRYFIEGNDTKKAYF